MISLRPDQQPDLSPPKCIVLGMHTISAGRAHQAPGSHASLTHEYRGFPPSGHSKKQNTRKPAHTKGCAEFYVRTRCVISVPQESRGFVWLPQVCFHLLLLSSSLYIVLLDCCYCRCWRCCFRIVLVCCRCLCLLFVQRQSCTMTEILSAMAQAIQKELGDRHRLETHR